MAVSDEAVEVGAYCREVETHLCRRNGGHLVRIVGPAFDMVSGWARAGIPLKVVFQGIDRHVERVEARGGRRRPVRIEFCEGDVLDAFDDWRRAVGVGLSRAAAGRQEAEGGGGDAETVGRSRTGPSLPAHLERAHLRLTSTLASARLPEALRQTGEEVAQAIDRIRGAARTARREARQRLLAELRALDEALMDAAWASAGPEERERFVEEARRDLAGFRDRMSEAAWAEAVDRAARQGLRQKWSLPRVALE